MTRPGGGDGAVAEQAVRVVHAAARSRFEVHVSGRLAGFAEYRLDGDTIAFTHTETDPRLRGRGLAAHAVRAGLDEARTRQWAVLPYCWYVRNWIAGHPDYLPSVPAGRRAEFGLGGTDGGARPTAAGGGVAGGGGAAARGGRSRQRRRAFPDQRAR